MKSHKLSCLLLLLLLVNWEPVNGLCSLDKQTVAYCHDLEDARYIETYHLHTLRAPSYTKNLGPGNFRNLTSLRHLDLSGGEIEVIESGSFAKLGFLQSLNLEDNKIRHLEAGAFDGLRNLHSLKLGRNEITHLPAALMGLKELRLLDVSGNPLNCNCASMKLRDALMARGVKISKKTQCAEPASAKAGSIFKPVTRMTCIFEKQDLEMQGDQPLDDNIEGSGDADVDQTLDGAEDDLTQEEKEIEQPEVEDVETSAPPLSIESSPTTTEELIPSAEASSTEVLTSSTAGDITFDENEESTKKDITPIQLEETSSTESMPIEEISSTEGIVSSSSMLSEKPEEDDDDDERRDEEGSGEHDDDGSGMDKIMPKIDYGEKTEVETEEDKQAEDETSSVSPVSSSTTTTTTESSWWGVISDGLGGLFGSSETTIAPATTTTSTTTTTEKSIENDLIDQEFIQVSSERTIEKQVVPVSTVPRVTDEETQHSPRTLEGENNMEIHDETLDPASSQEAKKGMGSYIVLVILLAILTVLIAFAAYKGDFCRKKKKRPDVERGTEMKDMQRSLLDQNSAQPKIQVSNGNTMENVPLMNSNTTPEEPKGNQRSYDIAPLTNGANKTNGYDINDPVKPPRKSMNHEIEAPLNGLNPPMEAIDAPNGTDIYNDSLDEDDRPHSPNAQRVKITLQENPDSVPKTPILITRLKGGENLVKAP